MAEVSNEQLQRELSDLKGMVGDLNQKLSQILQPMQEVEINSVARDVSRGNFDALAALNARNKQRRKKQ